MADGTNNRVLVYDVAAITNGEDAVDVLGQSNFTSTTGATTQGRLAGPTALAYDPDNKRLFVAEASNRRVVVYDLAAITTGENAASVLGQADFTSAAIATTQSSLNAPEALAYDRAGQRLFVADTANHRVMVYDVASIANGENAANVLGQPNFTSGAAATTQSGLNEPRGLAYDPDSNRLYVADNLNHRVLVYDVAAISDGENAVNVLGKGDFTQTGSATSQSRLDSPYGLAYDGGNKLLYVADEDNERVLVFDVAAITDGEAAIDLIGQSDDAGNPDYTSARDDNALGNRRGLNSPGGASLDTVNHRLFVADSNDVYNHRVLVYNLDANNQLLDRQPDAVLGQANFTSRSANRGGSVAANTLNQPKAVGYDPTRNLLFVGDDVNARVLAYDVAAITNGENAVNVLGQPHLLSSALATTRSGLGGATDLAYDRVGRRLFVADGCRVLVYDVASIIDGEEALAVLGQPGFTSCTAATTQSGLDWATGLAYDPAGQRLFVADQNNHRVLVYDVTSITNGQNAVNVLGQPNFTTGVFTTTQSGLREPSGLAYDPNGNRLFVADTNNHRVLVHDVSTISNGQNAIAVVGQGGFTSGLANRGGSVAANTLNRARGVAYDPSANRLYVMDSSNNRVLAFNAAPTGTALSINAGAAYANSISATLTLTATGAAQMQVSESVTFTGATYQTYATTLPFTLTAGDGARALYARFRDSTLGVSAAVSDTILLDTTPPLTFTLASPATGTITNTASPTLAWGASSDALSGLAKYQLYIDGALNRDNIVTGAISITATGTLTEGLHTWSVAAVDNAGNSRASSATNSLTVDTTPPLTFTLSSPATGAFTNTATPTFAWEASSDATSGLAKYQLWVDGALNRDNIITTTLSITPTSTLTDGLHTWSVSAVDNAGNTRDSSATNSLTVDTTPPLTFALSSPVTGAITNTATPTFAWEASSDATSGLAKYQLWVDGALNRDNIITTTLSITPTSTLTDGLHTWMVVAVDNAGNTRASTSTYTVTVDTVAPSLSGVGVTEVTTRTATITWTSSEASSSQVEYGPTAAYGSSTAEADTSPRVISHTVSLSGLTPGATYHYRVKGRDEAGNSGVSSDGAFTTTTTAVLLYLPMLARASSGGW